MKKFLILTLIFGLTQTAITGEMFKWVDKNGVTRFTNTAPPPDAKKVGNEVNYKAEPITPDSEKPDYMKYDKPSKKETSSNISNSSIEKSVSNYKFNWSTPRMNGNELTLSGTVEGGEKCKILTVDVFLYDENSNLEKIICRASDVGGSGSRLIEGKTTTYSLYGSNWKVKSTFPDCLK